MDIANITNVYACISSICACISSICACISSICACISNVYACISIKRFDIILYAVFDQRRVQGTLEVAGAWAPGRHVLEKTFVLIVEAVRDIYLIAIAKLRARYDCGIFGRKFAAATA